MTSINDPERIKQRHAAFWQCEVVDHAVVAILAPAESSIPWPPAADDEERLTDPDFNVRNWRAWVAHQHFLGDALPMVFAQGNLVYPAWGGAGKISQGTVWVDPTVQSWEEWATYRFDRHNPWLQRFLRVNAVLAQQAQGEFYVGTQGTFGAMDAMALMRGYEDFLIELALEESSVALHAAQREAIEGYRYLITSFWDDVEPYQHGTMMSPGIWAPGRINYFSADWTALIGPKDFERWMMPELAAMCEMCDFALYHLDGPNAVRHLPLIAELPTLHGIQYTPSPGDSLDYYIEVSREIQRNGKCTYMCVSPANVERVLAELDPRGLFIRTDVGSEEEGRELLRHIRKGEG